jgi:Cu/Zn superoxide dismutase
LLLLLFSSIIGRAVVLHEREDNCSAPTGHAGNFIAVGVIGIVNAAGNTAASTY